MSSKCSMNKGNIEPVCNVPIPTFPNYCIEEVELPQSIGLPPFCNLLPEITFDQFLANLPLMLLLIFTAPIRLLFCVLFYFFSNVDVIVFLILQAVYNIIDYVTEPFLYFAYGLGQGLELAIDRSNSIPPPSCCLGLLRHVYLLNKGLYKAIGSFFEKVGQGLGFILGLLVLFYNSIIYYACFITYLTFCICLGACFGITIGPLCIPDTPACIPAFTLKFGGSYSQCFQPFLFLSSLLKFFDLNCCCALGTPPKFDLGLSINVGCNSNCKTGLTYHPPQCSVYPTVEESGTYSTPPYTTVLHTSEYTYCAFNEQNQCTTYRETIECESQNGVVTCKTIEKTEIPNSVCKCTTSEHYYTSDGTCMVQKYKCCGDTCIPYGEPTPSSECGDPPLTGYSYET